MEKKPQNILTEMEKFILENKELVGVDKILFKINLLQTSFKPGDVRHICCIILHKGGD
ncbi:MAG: hypothetical protein ACOZFS_06655 [Thermodesulfobacteriota bacterium]